MEVLQTNETNITSEFNNNTMPIDNKFEISSNWLVVEANKKLENVISCELAANCPSKMTLNDIVDEKRCLEIKPNVNDNDGCTIDIKMKNKYKIVRIGVVSEASVLEIFRDAGEYETTSFAEFIDEFEDSSVYYAEITIDRPTTEASIKFRRIKNYNRTTMFLYGIRIIVEEVTTSNSSEQLLESNIVNYMLKIMCKNKNSIGDQQNKLININEQNEIKATIRNEDKLTNDSSLSIEALEASVNIKLQQMEQRLIQKLDLLEENTNKKLNDIMSLLEMMKKNLS